MYTQRAYGNNLELEVHSASPLELTRLLYRGALEAIETARTCLTKGDIEGRGRAVSRGSAIVLELAASLNLEAGGEVAASLAQIYEYVNRLLLTAHLEQRPEPLEEAQRLLRTLLEGWEACPDGAAPGVQPDPQITDFTPHLAAQEYGQWSYRY